MQTIMRSTLKLTAVLLLVAALLGSGLSSVTTAAAASCSPTISFDLWAKTGTATLYGSTTVNIWGYAANSGDPASLPGPVLDVPEGACVGVTLHNDLSETTAILFQGQDMVPDLTGVAPAGSSTYTFTASKPGTFLYEAGLIPHTQHQTAMGLYGTLIVRPATPNQAYASASTAFDEEAVLVLSEYDTAMAANPASFDMRKFAPKYFLINGKAYPDTAPVSVTTGNTVLLRYVNAGLQSHAMSLLGFSQNVIATDGSAFAYSHKMVSETIAPGQTLDAIIEAPSAVADGSKFALYDANMLLRNNTGAATNAGLGGMLTFLTVGGGSPVIGPDAAAPLLSSLALSPNPSTGAVSVALSFAANDLTTGNSNITAAEYWIDGNATHTPIPVGVPAPSVVLNDTLAAGLSAGTHVVTVRAQDAAGNWSAAANINLVVDNVGPATSGLSLNPNPSSGAVSVLLSFSANDSASGNSNVTAAEYWIDSGAHQPVTVASPSPVKVLNVTIPSGLTAGSHVIHARSQDALGNWGAEAPTINLIVDNAGPATSSVSATPNPINGTKGRNTSVQAVRVTASFSDLSSGGAKIANAEGFLDAPAVTGTGFVFIANDGNFNSPSESGFADIPLVVAAALSNGPHPICVHAKDAVGNWGPFDCSYMLNVDKVRPTVTSITRVNANPSNAANVQFLVTFSESVIGVTSSNFTVVKTGLSGSAVITSIVKTVADNGLTWTVNVSTGNGNGTLGLNLTSIGSIKDIANNSMSNAGLPLVGQVYTITHSLRPRIILSGIRRR